MEREPMQSIMSRYSINEIRGNLAIRFWDCRRFGGKYDTFNMLFDGDTSAIQFWEVADVWSLIIELFPEKHNQECHNRTPVFTYNSDPTKWNERNRLKNRVNCAFCFSIRGELPELDKEPAWARSERILSGSVWAGFSKFNRIGFGSGLEKISKQGLWHYI